MLIIDVIPEDVFLGTRRSAHYCPIAMAIRRIMPGSSPVVARNGVMVGGQVFKHSPASLRFMEQFDAGVLKPSSFEPTWLALG